MAASSTLNNSAAKVLAALERHYNVKDEDLAEAIGEKRVWVEARRNGRTSMKVDDLAQLAEAFQLPPTVFLMEPLEALRFALDHGPTDLPFARSRCALPSHPTLFDFDEHAVAA